MADRHHLRTTHQDSKVRPKDTNNHILHLVQRTRHTLRNHRNSRSIQHNRPNPDRTLPWVALIRANDLRRLLRRMGRPPSRLEDRRDHREVLIRDKAGRLGVSIPEDGRRTILLPLPPRPQSRHHHQLPCTHRDRLLGL